MNIFIFLYFLLKHEQNPQPSMVNAVGSVNLYTNCNDGDLQLSNVVLNQIDRKNNNNLNVEENYTIFHYF